MKLLGVFNEQQVRNGEDKVAVNDAIAKDPTHKYVKAEFVMKKGKIVAMKIYMLTSEEYLNSPDI